MSKVGPEHRSFLPIETEDLQRLLEIARRDLQEYFREKPVWSVYADRVICVALIQGAAQHLVTGGPGINDFDVCTFFRKYPGKPWYARRIKSYDFGLPKFGKSYGWPNFVGRRVDCMGRSIDAAIGEGPAEPVRRWLRAGKPGDDDDTRWLWSQKAVVLLAPDMGRVIWPVAAGG